MKSRTQLLIACVSAMAVTMVAVSETGRTSPGKLATVHQREPDLSGKNDCSACHGGLFDTMREACLGCHEPIAGQLETSTGLHGTLGARAEQCGLCHAEHHGGDAPLVHGQSFALAGVSKIGEFDHRMVGFPMGGAHSPLDCTVCHENARALILRKDQARYLGLDRGCASCHEDAHEGRLVLACASCHGQETWDGLHSQDHERFLPLVGGHGDLDCLECHARDGPHGFEILGGAGPRPAPRTCVDCHESPHTPAFGAGAARLADRSAATACVVCHVPEHTNFHGEALLTMTKEQHAVSGFPLDAPHDQVACSACHAVEKQLFAERYPGRGADQCVACHEDVHAGQFDAAPFVVPSGGQGCLDCHERTHFEPHAFTTEKHALAALDLTGKHLEIGCEECHEKPGPEAARVFRGTPAECETCHEDAHAGFFDDYVGELETPKHGRCERCHDTVRFSAAEASFDHARFTGFPVAGAHAESQCGACHPSAAEPDAAGRVFGRVSERFGTFAGCVTCHADPHDGRFDVSRGFPALVAGHADCARCHVESSFRSLPRGFDHGDWTGFTLAGAHAAASCSACHAPLSGLDEHGRTSGEAAGPLCADCHEDPHAGQFAAPDGTTDCQRCHDDALEDFHAFDHERDSRFALGEAHRALECAACHKTELQDGLTLTRYRPLGAQCVDCHGSNAEVLLRRKPRKG